jgi:hypothetical protein
MQSQARSKSAEVVRNKPFANSQSELTHQSLQRLNAVLSIGISGTSSLQMPLGSAQSPPGCDGNQLTEAGHGGKAGFTELRNLKEMLGKALAGTAQVTGDAPLKPLGGLKQSLRNASNDSISTMAPDNESECGELPRSGLKGLGMRNAWSSNSVSTMVSDWDESIAEIGELEFELCVEDQDQHGVQQEVGPTSSAISRARKNGMVGQNDSVANNRDEFCHGLVPRTQNLEEMYNKTIKDKPPTSLMIRNVPSRYSHPDLMADLKDLGLGGTFDFLYIPVDKGTTANVGYAFVNFLSSTWADKCMRSFQNYRFKRYHRSPYKLASVSVAHIQGLERNLQHYENSAVNASKQTLQRPVVMANIMKMLG